MSPMHSICCMATKSEAHVYNTHYIVKQLTVSGCTIINGAVESHWAATAGPFEYGGSFSSKIMTSIRNPIIDKIRIAVNHVSRGIKSTRYRPHNNSRTAPHSQNEMQSWSQILECLWCVLSSTLFADKIGRANVCLSQNTPTVVWRSKVANESKLKIIVGPIKC